MLRPRHPTHPLTPPISPDLHAVPDAQTPLINLTASAYNNNTNKNNTNPDNRSSAHTATAPHRPSFHRNHPTVPPPNRPPQVLTSSSVTPSSTFYTTYSSYTSPPSRPPPHPQSQPQTQAQRSHFPNPSFADAQLARMDHVNIPDDAPPGMKPVEQILKRAKELKKAEPAVAYWCCFSAAQKALKVQNRTKEDTMFLMSLIDALEAMKAALANNEAITSEAAGAAYVENFALKVFMSADNDDRAGLSGKGTIRKFVVAGQFIEVLRCFEHGMTEEMEQKLQYARWKAADGAKALREGRTPVSGPPVPENDPTAFPVLPGGSPGDGSYQLHQSPPSHPAGAPGGNSARDSFSSSTRPLAPSPPVISPRPSPGLSARTNMPPVDLQHHPDRLHTPVRSPGSGEKSGSGAWSTVATPGLPDDEGGELHFDLNRPQAGIPSVSVGTPPEGRFHLGGSGGGGTGGGEKRNVRFMGPDGAPLSPASTHITVESYDAPPAPPPTDFASSPGPSAGMPLPSAPAMAPGSGGGADWPSGDPVSGASAGTGRSPSGGYQHIHSSQPSANGRPRGDSSASLGSTGSGAGGAGASTIPRPKPASNPSNQVANPTRISTVPSSFNAPPPPPPSLASAPHAPPPAHLPVHPQAHGLGLTSPPVSQGQGAVQSPAPSGQSGFGGYPSGPAPGPTPKSMSRKDVEQTQKHAKWAVSALDYDDYETARSELRKALNLLGGSLWAGGGTRDGGGVRIQDPER